ncbi:MAG: TetR/AcrR family transcriptional regulator [Parvularculaceae bacterium]|nr:TetR/AcrR family transcriptional regulator [Parvularculaceae bacterium]
MTLAPIHESDPAAGTFDTDSDWFEHPSSTRRRLEEAAARLFSTKGIDGTTTREIARAAGCSEGVIYRHWPSKETLARYLFMSVHRRITAHVRSTIGKGARIEDQVRAIVGIYCGLADWQWDRFAFHLLSTNRFLPTPEGEDNPVDALEDIVRAAMERGEIPRRDPVVVTAMALGVLFQTALHKVYGRIGGQLRPHAPAITRAVIAVLKAEENRAA